MEPKKNFIQTLAIALGIIVVLLGAIWYVKADIDGKFVVVRQLRLELQPKEISLSNLAKLQSDAEKSKQFLPIIDQLFTAKNQLLSFSSDIGFIVKQAGFTGVPQFKEETVAPSGDMQKTNFSLLLEGTKSFSDLANLFKLVEESKYFVRFKTINVSNENGMIRAGADGYVLSFQ